MDTLALFYLLLFLVAFLYASVGHGGASGYLALMALFSVTPEVMKPTALLLNLFVSLTSFIQFYRGGHFRWKVFWPFALASIPLAYLGGLVIVEGSVYKKILGLLLLVPIIRFYFFSNAKVDEQAKSKFGLSLLIGGSIGFFSGLIGIGGGILLSPILLLLKWTDQKQTAAISALFIFVHDRRRYRNTPWNGCYCFISWRRCCTSVICINRNGSNVCRRIKSFADFHSFCH